jgi:transposase
MKTTGSRIGLQQLRVLAVERVVDGYSVEEVASFLEFGVSTVRRWVAAYRRSGLEGLVAKPVPGRPRKLTRTQEKIVLRWLDDPPTQHGFNTELWTAARVAELISEEWGVELNRRYVCRWLRARDITPQRPQRVPRERNPEVIAAWLETEWQRLKKKRRASVELSFSSTKAGF